MLFKKNHLFLVFFTGLLIAILFITNCTTNLNSKGEYENINNTKATYVGMDKCKTCHADIYKTYIETGMGQSWGLANPKKSAGNFDANIAHVYDAKNNLHYKPYWQNDSLHILEYRIADGDTIHKRDEKIDYIVGSGQHTNSHIYSSNGYLHQAPITFYTQLGKWDMAPGYEDENTRFDRKIETECITCHNGYPDWVAGSFNKYNAVKLGIDCERCHGPGSLHVDGILAGKIHDTSKSKDTRIVNPRRMTIEQQNNLCQRCHLQGISVLNDDKTFFDFMPSQNLSDSWNVFMPEYKNKNNHMIMASHVERMKMSKCFTVSKKMSCITCHNPHISVKVTSTEVYNFACKNCHQTNNKCSAPMASRKSNRDNCNACHMKKNSSIDIPHVAVHDHFIKKNINEIEAETKDGFLGMLCYNNNNVDILTKARSFLEFHERYLPSNALIDSALIFLNTTTTQEKLQNKDIIRAYYLLKNYNKVIELAKKFEANIIKDYWNAYRIATAYYETKNYRAAQPYYLKTTQLMPFNLDFQNALAQNYINMQNFNEAQIVLDFILKENPKNEKANSNLGFMYLQKGDLNAAKKNISQAVALNPNNIQAMINLAVVYYQKNDQKAIKPMLKKVLNVDPNNEQAKAMLNDLK